MSLSDTSVEVKYVDLWIFVHIRAIFLKAFLSLSLSRTRQNFTVTLTELDTWAVQ